jgi:agmatine deiminase
VQERNPGFKRGDYEAVFEKYLGISNVIWLGDGIVGDDTHGHVDDLARFTDASTVVTVVEKDKRHDNYAKLQDNLKRLKVARDQDGKQLTVVELPMPREIPFEDMRLPASYANFLICNHAVLVPTFNDPADRMALNILAELFPKREVVGLHALDMVWGLGTIHCLSQQEPA